MLSWAFKRETIPNRVKRNTPESCVILVFMLPSVIVLLFIGILIPMVLTLSSCEKEKMLEEGMNAKIDKIDIDTATKN